MLNLIMGGLGIVGLAIGVILALACLVEAPPERQKKQVHTILTISLIGGALLLTGSMSFTSIEAGNVGVYKTFGRVDLDHIAEPGLVFKPPWVDVINFNVQQHEVIEQLDGGSKDRVKYVADLAIIYQVDPKYAPWIYQEIGTQYEGLAISSNVRDTIREVLGQYEAMYAYSDGREQVSKSVYVAITPVLAERHLRLLNSNFRTYDIPNEIKNAAALKKSTEQQIETAAAKVQIEKQNALALVEVGKGIQQYQQIVQQDLTPELIQWRGQEKLVEAARYGNMIIVVTDGRSSLPFMMQNTEGSKVNITQLREAFLAEQNAAASG